MNINDSITSSLSSDNFATQTKAAEEQVKEEQVKEALSSDEEVLRAFARFIVTYTTRQKFPYLGIDNIRNMNSSEDWCAVAGLLHYWLLATDTPPIQRYTPRPLESITRPEASTIAQSSIGYLTLPKHRQIIDFTREALEMAITLDNECHSRKQEDATKTMPKLSTQAREVYDAITRM